MHGVPSIAWICGPWAGLCHWQIIIFWPEADMAWSPLGQDTVRGSSEGFVVRLTAENYWGPTQISLQKQPSWAWRAVECRVWSIFGDWLLLRKFTPLTGQRNSVYFNQLFFVDREGAWSFLLLKQHCLWALQVYCVKEIHPDRNPRQIWVSDDTSMSPTLCVGGQWPDAELIPGRGAEQ